MLPLQYHSKRLIQPNFYCPIIAPQHNLADVEEVCDTDAYPIPDPEVVNAKSKREEQNILKSSENQKLLKDALEDLSGDESPPEIPIANEGQGIPSQVPVASHELPQQEGSMTSVGSSTKVSS
jgi:hypothetical protein